MEAVKQGFIPGLPSGGPTVAVMGRPTGAQGGVQPAAAAKALPAPAQADGGGGLMSLLGLGTPAAPAAPAAPSEETRGVTPAAMSGTGFEQSRPVSGGSSGSGGGSGMVVTSTPTLYEA